MPTTVMKHVDLIRDLDQIRSDMSPHSLYEFLLFRQHFICSSKRVNAFDRELKWPTHCTAVSAAAVDLHLTEVQHP